MEETYSPKGNIHGPILPQFIMEKNISLGAKVMYALLCDYAGKNDHCWPSQETLSRRLSCSITSVKKYLGELVNEKLVAVKKENYRSCVYYLLKPECHVLPNTSGQTTRNEPKSDHIQPKSVYMKPECGYLNTLNKQIKNTPPNPPRQNIGKDLPQTRPYDNSAPAARGVGASISDFEEAWKAYPKKEAIGFARRIWVKLHKNKKLPPLGKIIFAIRSFADSPGWQREEGRYIPQFGKWLLDERWLDGFLENCPERDAEAARKNEALRAFLAKRELERTREQEEETRQRRPIFDAFLSRFSNSERMRGPAWGLWNLLYSKNKAPRAEDVSPENTLDVMNYLNLCKAA